MQTHRVPTCKACLRMALFVCTHKGECNASICGPAVPSFTCLWCKNMHHRQLHGCLTAATMQLYLQVMVLVFSAIFIVVVTMLHVVGKV